MTASKRKMIVKIKFIIQSVLLRTPLGSLRGLSKAKVMLDTKIVKRIKLSNHSYSTISIIIDLKNDYFENINKDFFFLEL